MSAVVFAVLVLALTLFGAWARRFMGGVGGKNPRVLHLLAVATPTTLAAGIVAFSAFNPLAAAGIALLVLAATMAVASTGDGDQTDLGTWLGVEPDEPFWGFANRGLGKPGYWRDFDGLLISGVAQTFVAGLAVAISGYWLVGALFALSGALKAPAYALAYVIPSNVNKLRQGRELGEALWGASLGLSAAVVIGATILA